MSYDYFDDEYYGNTDTVSYCRWHFNRFGAESTAKSLGIPTQLAYRIGTSGLPGKTKISEIDTFDKLKELERKIESARNAIIKKSNFQEKFHKTNSRKLKVRLNKLFDSPKMYVLRNLLEAEEYNIKAKDCPYKYQDYNYAKKSECLLMAITRLTETGWDFWWQPCKEGLANYIFYVELPCGQVSWHGTATEDMKSVPMDDSRKWDGSMAVTLPRIIETIVTLCPSILNEPFDKKKCLMELAT